MVSGVPTGISFASSRMSALRMPHAAVRDPARDQARRSCRGRRRSRRRASRSTSVRGRARDERQRPVERARAAVAPELRADVELALRRRPLRLPDADRRAEHGLAALDERRLNVFVLIRSHVSTGCSSLSADSGTQPVVLFGRTGQPDLQPDPAVARPWCGRSRHEVIRALGVRA